MGSVEGGVTCPTRVASRGSPTSSGRPRGPGDLPGADPPRPPAGPVPHTAPPRARWLRPGMSLSSADPGRTLHRKSRRPSTRRRTRQRAHIGASRSTCHEKPRPGARRRTRQGAHIGTSDPPRALCQCNATPGSADRVEVGCAPLRRRLAGPPRRPTRTSAVRCPAQQRGAGLSSRRGGRPGPATRGWFPPESRAASYGHSISQSATYSARPQATRSVPEGTAPSSAGRSGSSVTARLRTGSARPRRRIGVRAKSNDGS